MTKTKNNLLRRDIWSSPSLPLQPYLLSALYVHLFFNHKELCEFFELVVTS